MLLLSLFVNLFVFLERLVTCLKDYLCYHMKSIREIYRYTFHYKLTALTVVFCNLMFVIFNLISMILFIPFLQLIFPTDDEKSTIVAPVYDGTFTGFFEYLKDSYNFFMQTMVESDPKGALLFVCISVLIAFFLKNLSRYGAIWFQSQLRMAVVRDLRQKLFDKAMVLPLSYYNEEKKGDLMSRMQSDVGEIENAVIAVLELFFREPIAIIINVAALLYWSPKLTLFSFILLPVSALVISRIGKSLKRTAGQEKEQMGTLLSKIEESLGGIRIIKAFNAIDTVKNSFATINLRHQQLVTKAFRKRDLSPPLNETLGVVVMLGIVWFGGSMILDEQVSTNHFSGKEFIGFILVFSQLLRPIQGVATSMANLNKAEASLNRINAILDTDEKILEKADAIKDYPFERGVSYNNVTFSYREEPVLKNVNLFIPKGKTIALVGESGSGKSTISDLLPRFYDPQEGQIMIDDIDIRNLGIRELRAKIGIVNQESILFNGTVKENITFGNPNASEEEIINASKIANAFSFVSELENGFETNIGERGNKLSGGQKQRLSIARAVLANPDILILDEATSALDTESEKLVQEALENLMKNRTVLIIAHRLSTVKNADEIIVLSKGEIIERGHHEELMQLNGTYYRLCELQGITS